MTRLLEGVRILDLSHTLAGPFATMVLADLGADVVKVEPPGGDETRHWAPHVGGESAYYLSVNRGKRSIVVDLKTGEGREIVYRLARRSHVVIENYRPGVREKLGVAPRDLFRVNPGLVYLSIKGFRPGSAYEGLPAYDIIVQGMSGLMASTGEEGRPPVRVSFALFDVITGLLASTYILAALHSPKRPLYLEAYLYDAALFAMSYIPMIYLATGKKPRRMGSGHPSIVPYQAFQAGDGKWLIVAAANDRLWEKLCKALGREDLLEDPRFKTNPDRVRNRGQLIPILEEAFQAKLRDEWLHTLWSHGVPAAPVYDIDEVFQDPYTEWNIYEISHPTLGKVKQIREPATINKEPIPPTSHPPLQGEHTDQILTELGYNIDEIKDLRKRGIVR